MRRWAHISAFLTVACALTVLAFAVGLRWVERAITFRPERPTASEQRPAAANQTSSAPDGSGSYPGAGHNVFGAAGPAYLDQLEEFIRAAVPPTAPLR